MHPLHGALTSLRSLMGTPASHGPAFWLVTALIALLLPSPLAAPLLLARLRRPTKE